MPLLNLPGAFERITDAFVALDTNWCYTFMNKKAGEIFGRDPGSMIGKHIWTEFSEGIDQPFYKAYYKAMETQEYIYLEEYYPPFNRWFENHIYPDPNGLSIFFRDITDRKKAELLLEGEKAVLEMMALNKPLEEILNRVALNYESYTDHALCSILLLDKNGTHVKHGAGPSLPDAFNKGIDGEPIGPVAGSCGTSAFTKQRVIVSDIANDPLWINYRDFALGFGLKASWSTPIMNVAGKVFGTFAIYYKECREPSESELTLIDRSVNQVKIILEKYNAETQLKENEEKYRNLIEYASDAIFITGPAGNYVDMNERACNLSGYSKSEIPELTINDLLVKENDPVPLRFEEILAGNTVIQQRYLKCKDGSVVPVEISARQLPGGNLLAIVRDLSERIDAKQSLQKAKELSDSIINNLPGIFYLYDEAGKFLRWNKNFENISGYSHQEISIMTPYDFYTADQQEKIASRISAVFENDTPGIEMELLTKQKEKTPFFINSVTVEYEGKQCLLGIGIDLSERKKADLEKDKIKSETDALINNTSDLLWSVSTDYKLIAANNTFIEEVHRNGGYLIKPGDNILGEGYFPEEYSQYWKDFYNKGLAGEKLKTEIFTPQANSSELLWFELKIEPIKTAGAIIGIACSMRDITERKKVKQALVRTEKRLQFLLSSTPAVIYSAAAVPPFAATFISDNITALSGYTADDFIGIPGFWSDNIHPDDKPKIMEDLAQLFEKGEQSHEYRFKLKDGRYVWMYDEVRLVYDEKGIPLEMVGYWINIDERKRSEQGIKMSEEKYRTLVEQASDAIFIADETGRLVTVNTSACILARLSEKELLQMRFQDFTVLEDVQKNPFHFDELKAGRSVITERVMKGKNGKFIHVEINAKMLTDGRILAFVRDISERVKNQLALAESENRLRTIVQTEPECIKILGLKGELEDMNPAGLAMIEADSLESVKGRSVLGIINEPYRNAFLELTSNVFEGIPGKLEFEVTGLKGTKRWLETHAVPLKDAAGKIISLLGVTRDITARRNAEHAIKQLNQELEHRVRERTFELEKAIEELEEINDLFVGREARIIELKEELEEMKK